jgi:hypothetical protein
LPCKAGMFQVEALIVEWFVLEVFTIESWYVSNSIVNSGMV